MSTAILRLFSDCSGNLRVVNVQRSPELQVLETQLTMEQLHDVAGLATRPLRVMFTYDPADPFAVTMTAHGVPAPVRWTFSRELLTEGVYEPTGDGDVHVWPCLSPCGEAVVIVELCSPAGGTLLQFPTRSVQEFVTSAELAVPRGREQVDVDAWLEQLLAG